MFFARRNRREGKRRGWILDGPCARQRKERERRDKGGEERKYIGHMVMDGAEKENERERNFQRSVSFSPSLLFPRAGDSKDTRTYGHHRIE